MASPYQHQTLSRQSHLLLIAAIEEAMPTAALMTAARLDELLGLLRDAHKIVLKYKHTKAA